MNKRIVSVITVFVMFISLFSFTNAALPENDIQPLYNYTISHSQSLSISGGVATGRAYLSGISSVTRIETEMIFQKKTALWWSEVDTRIKHTNNNVMDFNVSTNLGSKGTYRIKVVHTVYKGTSSEKITAYSAEKTY